MGVKKFEWEKELAPRGNSLHPSIGVITTADLAMTLLMAERRSKIFSREIVQRWTYFLSSSSGNIMRLASLKVEIFVKEVLFICSVSCAWTGTSGGVKGTKNWPC
ncbi:hypothetical protein FXO37_09050 [Capsicum annuum]|nr:hypothetical protein FXO37_09050 [Capsicum annuum]